PRPTPDDRPSGEHHKSRPGSCSMRAHQRSTPGLWCSRNATQGLGQPLTRRRLVAMRVTVARIGKAHGLKGEVTVELRTDIPEDRLYPGAVLDTDPPTAGPLTVQSVRQQAGRWYVRFEQIADRTAAENARGIELLVE